MNKFFILATIVFCGLTSARPALAVDPFLWGKQARREYRDSLKDSSLGDLKWARVGRGAEIGGACLVNGVQTVLGAAAETIPIVSVAEQTERLPSMSNDDFDRVKNLDRNGDVASNALLGGLITFVGEGANYAWDYLKGNRADDKIVAYIGVRTSAKRYFSEKDGSGACRRAIDRYNILTEEIEKIEAQIEAAHPVVSDGPDVKQVAPAPQYDEELFGSAPDKTSAPVLAQ